MSLFLKRQSSSALRKRLNLLQNRRADDKREIKRIRFLLKWRGLDPEGEANETGQGATAPGPGLAPPSPLDPGHLFLRAIL